MTSRFVAVPDQLVSSNLERETQLRETVDPLFCIGLEDFCICTDCYRKRHFSIATMNGNKPANTRSRSTDHECEGNLRKKLKLSLQCGDTSTSRFASPCTNDEMQVIAKGKRSLNTERNTLWAIKVFNDWAKERNGCPTNCEKVPDDFLEKRHSEDVDPLNHWLSRFVVEARKRDGKPYTPTSIHSLLAALLRYMREVNHDTPDFLSKKDWRFKELHGSVESVFVSLRQNGIGADVKHTPVISPKEELLWERGILGTDTPLKLQRAVFYLVGKVFCVRGGQEQRNLKPSQFKRHTKPDRYVILKMDLRIILELVLR